MKKDLLKSNISSDVLKWRREAGYTQQELADLLDVNRKAVIEWETGKKIPNKTSRQKLSNIFNQKVTQKGISETNTDMKKDKESDSSEGEWYKKTIDSLIQQHETIIDKYTIRTDRQIDGLEQDKVELWGLIRIHMKPPQDVK